MKDRQTLSLRDSFSVMKRRLFLKTSLASTLAMTLSPAGAALLGENAASADMFFYDERFAQARAISSRINGAISLTPVTSDVTALWTQQLNSLSRQAPLCLRGVTTESFYFCLKTLLQSHAGLKTRVERVSKDLYAWSISTTLTTKTG